MKTSSSKIRGASLVALLLLASAASTSAAPGVPAVAASVSSKSAVEVQAPGEIGFERRGDAVFYRGFRGSRDRQPSYRQHNGFWFPPAAFADNGARGAVAGGGGAHVQWCRDRYRSYRASDNTFQPFNGPRRQCDSLYDR